MSSIVCVFGTSTTFGALFGVGSEIYGTVAVGAFGGQATCHIDRTFTSKVATLVFPYPSP